MALDHDHGLCEQSCSEFKTELDPERLPSGKLATNALVLEHGLLAYDRLVRPAPL